MIIRQFVTHSPISKSKFQPEFWEEAPKDGELHVYNLKDSEVRFEAENVTQAIDLVFQKQSMFVNGSLVEVNISTSSEHLLKAQGNNTTNTLSKLTFQNFKFSRPDKEKVVISMKGQIAPPSKGKYRALFIDSMYADNAATIYCSLKGQTHSHIEDVNGWKKYYGEMMTKIDIFNFNNEMLVFVSYITFNSNTGEIVETACANAKLEDLSPIMAVNLRYYGLIINAVEQMKNNQHA